MSWLPPPKPIISATTLRLTLNGRRSEPIYWSPRTRKALKKKKSKEKNNRLRVRVIFSLPNDGQINPSQNISNDKMAYVLHVVSR